MKTITKSVLVLLMSSILFSCSNESVTNSDESNSGSTTQRLSVANTALPAVYVAGIDVNKFRPLLQSDFTIPKL